jgi:hypothetical protein
MPPDSFLQGRSDFKALVEKRFELEYSRTALLHYRGQIPLEESYARIQQDLARL